MPFHRIAIVNRGEPAMRFINAVTELNREGDHRLTTIALYTDPDRHAWFVREADEAVCIGPATTFDERAGREAQTYLDHDRLERALIATGAEAAGVIDITAPPAENVRRVARAAVGSVAEEGDVSAVADADDRDRTAAGRQCAGGALGDGGGRHHVGRRRGPKDALGDPAPHAN